MNPFLQECLCKYCHILCTICVQLFLFRICWPYDGDQPANAASVVAHGMGYELFEVRSGNGLLPIHRLGGRVVVGTVDSVKSEFKEVLTKARGEDGRTKRENVRKFREALMEYWKPGGESWKEIEKITDMLAGKK